MVRFIMFCMAFTALSFVVVPLVKGISTERNAMMETASINAPSNDSLTFEEIYQIGNETSGQNLEQNIALAEEFDPASLNDIAPAAGAEIDDGFSTGFSGREDSALESQAPVIIKTSEPSAL